LSIQPLNLDELVADVLAAMKYQLDETGADVRVGPLPRALGDRTQTSQVFANLIDNAVKYRAPERPLRIDVSGSIRDGQAVYAVADNGIGMAPEHQAKAFEIF